VPLTPEAADADAAVVAALVQTMREPRVSLAPTAATGRYAPLLELLPASSLLLVNAMCVAGGTHCGAGGARRRLLRARRLRHAARRADGGDCARGRRDGPSRQRCFAPTAPSTKLLGAYTRLCCQTYLCNLLRPLVSALTASGDDLEVDPMKCDEASARAHQPTAAQVGRSRAGGGVRLARRHAAVDALARGAHCRGVGAQVSRQQSAERGRLSCSCASFARRWRCPRRAVWCAPTRRRRRSARCCSSAKLLQNLANNANFSKEPYMMPFNSFIADNQAPWAAFVDKLVAVDLSSSGGAPLATARRRRLEALAVHCTRLSPSTVDKVKQSLDVVSPRRHGCAGRQGARHARRARRSTPRRLESYASK
jgi:hypothetical protein